LVIGEANVNLEVIIIRKGGSIIVPKVFLRNFLGSLEIIIE